MARVRFTADHDHHVTPRSLKAYKGGRAYTVKRAWAEKFIAAGKAVEVAPPPRPATPAPSRRRAAAKVAP